MKNRGKCILKKKWQKIGLVNQYKNSKYAKTIIQLYNLLYFKFDWLSKKIYWV